MAPAQHGEAFSEAYAAEVLDRLDDSGFKQDVAETDMLGSDVSEPFRTMCTQLAAAVAAVSVVAPPPQSNNSVEGAVSAVQRTAGSEDSARGGRLDTALLRLLRSLNSGSKATQRIQVVEELVGYLQAARMLAAAAKNRQPPTAELAALAADSTAAETPQEMEIDGEAAAVSAKLHALAEALQVLTEGRSGDEVIAEMVTKADALLRQLPASYQQPLLSRDSLTEAQLKQLSEIDAGLRAEHMLRRHMLTERAKVTLQSFLWSKRLKERGTEADAAAAAARGEAAMMAEPSISVEDIFTFCQADLAAIGAKVTSGTGGGARASVKSVLIGAVPDRGGRAEGREAQALANMPAFAARKGAPADMTVVDPKLERMQGLEAAAGVAEGMAAAAAAAVALAGATVAAAGASGIGISDLMAMMTVTVSRLEELQEWFPQHTRGCIQDVLEQVGSERAPEVLLDLTSDSGQGALHTADIHPSQLFAALLPTEEAAPPATRAASLMSGGTSTSCNGFPTSTPRTARSPVPLRRPPSPPPLCAARCPATAANGMQPGVRAGQRTWWPPWQGGKPMQQQHPPSIPAPMRISETMEGLPQQLEELLQTLNSGSDDSSDSDAGAAVLSKQPSPKMRPYNPTTAISAAASPRPAAMADGNGSDDEGDTTTEQLLHAMLGADSAGSTERKKGVMAEGIEKGITEGTTKSIKQSSRKPETQAAETDNKPSAGHSFDWGSWEGVAQGDSTPALQAVHQGPVRVPLPQVQSRAVTPADVRQGPVLGAASINDLVAVCSGVHPVAAKCVGSDGVVATEGGGSNGGALPYDPGSLQGGQPVSHEKRPLSAAASLYSLNGDRKKLRGRSASRDSSRGSRPQSVDAKSEASSQSSGGVWDNAEMALEFLESGFPEHDLSFVKDMLAELGGDANAVTTRLLEMRDEAEAHRVAAQLQELRQAPVEQVEMDEGQKLALLVTEFPELSRSECRNALEAQAGNLQAAAAILALHASSAAAEKEAADFQIARHLQEQEAAKDAGGKDAEIARRLHDMQLADAAASPPTLLPSPAASPEDLAAIAALEAGQDMVLQPPRPPTPPPNSMRHTAASTSSAIALYRPPPPPAYQRFNRDQQKSANDALYDEMRGPAQRLWDEYKATMQAASTAFRKGKTRAGHQLVAEAADLKLQAKAKEDEASLAIFRAKNLRRQVDEIDLHGQHVHEALEMLRDLMAPYIKYRHHPVVVIITGRGSHSEDGEAKLRPVVLQYLQQQGLHFTEKPGSFEVYFHG